MKSCIFYSIFTVALLTGCNRLSKEDVAAYNLLIEGGNNYLQLNEIDKALSNFKDAQHINPKGLEAAKGILKVYQHNCQTLSLDCDKAQTIADSLQQL